MDTEPPRPDALVATARGRAAGVNPANRFEPLHLEVLDETREEAARLHPDGVQVLTEVVRDGTRSVINRVDSPDLPFHWTLNPYRGCSHGCSYCVSGETAILMGDGTTRLLADLRIGDEIYGTRRRGSCRRLTPTRVLAHWTTRKKAYRVTLDDGTKLVTSADHRFLTQRGWKHVCDQGPARRPALTSNDEFVGVERQPSLTCIEPLPGHRELFDMTTGTGDFIANGVVSHNCYARPTHETLGFSCGLDFETKIVAKTEAPRLLERELAAPSWRGEPITMSGVTDCYQPLERRLRITRGCLEVMAACRQPVSIVTKNRLVTRDLDLLSELARHRAVFVAVSLTTLDRGLAARLEPRASTPPDRLRTIRELAAAGVPTMAMLAPIIPGLTDREIPSLLEAAAGAGAISAAWVMLRLPHGVKVVFSEWLERQEPLRARHVLSLVRQVSGGEALYDPRFGRRHRGTGPIAEQIRQTFEIFRRRHGLDRPLPGLSSESFRPPAPRDGQLGLFSEVPPP